MPQRLSADPPTRLNLHLPQSLRQRLDRHLWDKHALRVPQGSYQTLIVRLLEAHLDAAKVR